MEIEHSGSGERNALESENMVYDFCARLVCFSGGSTKEILYYNSKENEHA